MLAFLGVVCLLGLMGNVEPHDYPVMNSGEPLVTDKDCSPACKGILDVALMAINGYFDNQMKEVNFTTDFCDGSVTGLAKFTSTHECKTNADGSIRDHVIALTFVKPMAELQCCLPDDPAAAAEEINKNAVLDGKCGKNKNVGDQSEKTPLVCQGGERQGQGDNDCKPVEIEADLTGMVVNIVLRVEDDVTYPLSFSFSTTEDNPAKLKDESSSFKNAWECVSNDANRDELFRVIFANAMKEIFYCVDSKKEGKQSIIDASLSLLGTCK